MLIRVVLVASVLLSMPRAGLASCEDAGFFIRWGPTPIVYGVVEGHRDPENGSRSLDLRVLRVLQGNEPRPAVRLWQLGAASAFVERFPVGRKLVVALAGGDMQYGLPEGAHALEVECSTRFVRVRESEDEAGLWLSEIERRLAAAR